MPTAYYLLIAFVLALLIGGGLSAYVWKVRRKRLEIAAGIDALAAMRWREFSHFVIEALQAQGFEIGGDTPSTPRGEQAADLTLLKDGHTWLVTCKQGANYRINTVQVQELADSVRFNGAAGGILATLGRIQPEARKNHRGMELVDGVTLWGLIEPLLPPSLTDHLAQKARQDAVRNTSVVWAFAALIAVVCTVLLATVMGGPQPVASLTPQASPTAAVAQPADPPAADSQNPAPAPAAAEPDVDDEETQRRALADELSAVAGVDHAAWSTRSTLVLLLETGNADGRIERICEVLGRYPDQRASRLQLQPPPLSEAPVRFMQCHAF